MCQHEYLWTGFIIRGPVSEICETHNGCQPSDNFKELQALKLYMPNSSTEPNLVKGSLCGLISLKPGPLVILRTHLPMKRDTGLKIRGK